MFVALNVIFESPVAAMSRDTVRVLVSGARLAAVVNEGKSEYVTPFGKTVDVPSVLIT
jgi:hypothetical protein